MCCTSTVGVKRERKKGRGNESGYEGRSKANNEFL